MAGNIVGYGIGYKVGPVLFSRPDAKALKREYVDKTHDFFERYGPRAIVLARFVPIVRTFITTIAGVARMDPRQYVTYSAIGRCRLGYRRHVAGFLAGTDPVREGQHRG